MRAVTGETGNGKRETTMTKKATHASFHGTSSMKPGYRVKIMAGSTMMATKFFSAYASGKFSASAAYAAAKAYAASFGVA
jgi:hypothetical protein